ncbi:YncE family protein [Mesorhizobium shangrilense]|uniref:Lactonase family protein n=1 Tax=Mesorhizobium shangrilense TaxID=460060 RepID=A0ABV2DJM2_9HYPH
MIDQIGFEASDAVRAALSAVGRTEDLRFSPDNRLLALAGYGRRRCLILRIDIQPTPDGPSITIHDFMELTSESMGEIHGLDFIDDRTFAVANRDGLVAIFALPPGEPTGQSNGIAPLREIKGGLFCKLKTPGSVVVRQESHGRYSLLVCNNYTHRVTRHVVNRWLGHRATGNHLLLEQGLDIPDGIAVSHDGQWIAVSSHGTRDVKMYRMSASLGPDTEPAGILQDANYPHGVRFTADDRHMLVADAGSPMLHVYERGTGWDGRRLPARSIAVLDEEIFLRGRTNDEEGGPKGLDIDRSNSVVAVTCEEQTLAFFSLASITGR